ncbi:Fic family protein [Parasphingorhabdus sp.]|uniref:Fic family protein n=1 Tax=Parasphingorhabdus sp. TaxID=2709688 RepID=UPI003D2C3FC5
MTVQITKRVQALQERYHKAAIDKAALLKLIYESEVAEQVYNSNAIENSTLSLEETDKILQQIDLDRFINERELFEAKNLARVVEYIHQNATKAEPSLDMMRLLHKMLISNIRDDIAGRFRKADEWVRIGSHVAAAPDNIVAFLHDMFAAYKASTHKPMIKRLSQFHLTFENIHPFVDGNGRIGRVLNNYLLIREGYVPINIQFIDRARYYDAFEAFDKNGDTRIMEDIIGMALSSSYHKRLAYLEGKNIMSLADYAQREKISHSNLLNKAKRQTIEAFWERGQWKIGA